MKRRATTGEMLVRNWKGESKELAKWLKKNHRDAVGEPEGIRGNKQLRALYIQLGGQPG